MRSILVLVSGGLAVAIVLGAHRSGRPPAAGSVADRAALDEHAEREAPAQTGPSEQDTMLAAHRRGLELQTREGGVWRTSNAAYQEEDGGIERFGIRHVLALGGVSATGCLWSERGDSILGVHWHFFQGWDPVERRPLLYQSGAGGVVGIGHEVSRQGDVFTAEQTFAGPDGTTSRIRHVTTQRGADSTVTQSFDWENGNWVSRRSYSWARDRSGPPPPC